MFLPVEVKSMEVAIFNIFELTIQIASMESMLECEKRLQSDCARKRKKNSSLVLVYVLVYVFPAVWGNKKENILAKLLLLTRQ